MTEKVLLDTDVLLAAHDLDAGEQRAIAEHVLRQVWRDRSGEHLIGGAASPVPRRAARDLVDALSVWPVVTVDAADILAASELEERHRLKFRDAMVVAAARKSRAALLLSSRIAPARHITGLEIRNPFA